MAFIQPAFQSVLPVTPIKTTSFTSSSSVCGLQSNQQLSARRRRASKVATCTLSEDTSNLVDVDEQLLESFSTAIKGEWVGYEGRFSSETGDALTIPDYYIPEQFVEWGLNPKGFEANHSLIVRNQTLYLKFFRILPTVSLFADHMDLEEDIKKIQLNEDSIQLFEDGSYVSQTPSKQPIDMAKTSKLSKYPMLNFCLRHDDRNCHIWLYIDPENKCFRNDVRVVIEKYSCHYCDGADIEGSSGFVDGWPSNPKTTLEVLSGHWKTQKDNFDIIRGSEEEDTSIIPSSLLLPGGVSCSFKTPSGSNGIVIEVGWLVDANTRVITSRSFDENGFVVATEKDIQTRQ